MVPILLLAAAAAAFAALLYAQRASVTVSTLAVIVVGYVLGHSFWNLHVGPLPLTLDRVLLAGLFVLVAWRWYGHQIRMADARIGGAEWALAVLLVWLTFSALSSRPDPHAAVHSSPIWRLLFSFWIPSALLLIARAAKESDRTYLAVLAGLTLLGAYLALTAIAETAGLWSVVFPRYIADPELGLHYGRARGPMLNSVSLGVHLTVCLWAAWLLLPRAAVWWKPVIALLLPVMLLAIFLTYTRSVYLGVAAGGAAVLAAQTPRTHRRKLLAGMLVLGVLAGPLLATKLLFLEREDSGAVARHSVQQRTAFAYVSWKMFLDHPLQGVGFGRFYDRKLPYLSDRSQSFELESIRELHHHNTLLSLLTETGMIGLAAYGALLAGLMVAAWRLANAPDAGDVGRRLGVLALGALVAYLPSAVFHDLSLVHSEQWLLFFTAGMALSRQRRLDGAPAHAGRPAPAEAWGGTQIVCSP